MLNLGTYCVSYECTRPSLSAQITTISQPFHAYHSAKSWSKIIHLASSHTQRKMSCHNRGPAPPDSACGGITTCASVKIHLFGHAVRPCGQAGGPGRGGV